MRLVGNGCACPRPGVKECSDWQCDWSNLVEKKLYVVVPHSSGLFCQGKSKIRRHWCSGGETVSHGREECALRKAVSLRSQHRRIEVGVRD